MNISPFHFILLNSAQLHVCLFQALRLPNFVMIPVGTGNVLALRWNGSHTVDSAVAALLLGKTVKWQMARMTSSDQQSMDKLSICCVEYGWSIDALHKMQTTTVKGKQKYLYGLIHSVKNHSEPFRVDLELTLSDKDEPVRSCFIGVPKKIVGFMLKKNKRRSIKQKKPQ